MQEIIVIVLVAAAGLWLLRRALARPGGTCGHCPGCGDAPAVDGACPSVEPPPKDLPPGS